MSNAIENLVEAQKFAMRYRPKVGGFPFLAEVLRQAGVTKNFWSLPSCQSIFVTRFGPVVNQGTPLTTGVSDVPPFNEEALVRALRKDQAGESTFPEFLKASWDAGIVGYEVDFESRKVTYRGANDESYVEAFAAVTPGAIVRT